MQPIDSRLLYIYITFILSLKIALAERQFWLRAEKQTYLTLIRPVTSFAYTFVYTRSSISRKSSVTLCEFYFSRVDIYLYLVYFIHQRIKARVFSDDTYRRDSFVRKLDSVTIYCFLDVLFIFSTRIDTFG